MALRQAEESMGLLAGLSIKYNPQGKDNRTGRVTTTCSLQAGVSGREDLL